MNVMQQQLVMQQGATAAAMQQMKRQWRLINAPPCPQQATTVEIDNNEHDITCNRHPSTLPRLIRRPIQW